MSAKTYLNNAKSILGKCLLALTCVALSHDEIEAQKTITTTTSPIMNNDKLFTFGNFSLNLEHTRNITGDRRNPEKGKLWSLGNQNVIFNNSLQYTESFQKNRRLAASFYSGLLFRERLTYSTSSNYNSIDGSTSTYTSTDQNFEPTTLYLGALTSFNAVNKDPYNPFGTSARFDIGLVSAYDFKDNTLTGGFLARQRIAASLFFDDMAALGIALTAQQTYLYGEGLKIGVHPEIAFLIYKGRRDRTEQLRLHEI